MAKSFQVDTGGTLTTGLVSYYKLGDTTDFFGSNNLTNNGSIVFSSAKVNNGAPLDGSTKYLTGTTTSFPVGSSDRSISFWVYINSLPATYAGLVGYGAATNNKNSQLLLKSDGTLYSWGSPTDFNGTTVLSTGQWYHIVETRSGTTVVQYINTASQTGTIGSQNTDAGTTFNIGIDTSSRKANAKFDEVGVWNKVLSTQEITDLYNGGNGQTMNPPIEIDSTGNAFALNATSISWTHTTGTGANRILWVGVGSAQNNSVTGVTYNSVAMTQATFKVVGGGNNTTSYLYYMINPPTGANTVVVSSTTSHLWGWSASYYGALQSGVPDATATNSSSSNVTSLTVTTTTVKDNCWIIASQMGSNNSAAGTGSFQRAIASNTAGALYDTNSFISPAGATGMTINQDSGVECICAASFAPVPPPGPANLKTWNGLAEASVKTINGLAIASVKSVNGLT